MSNRKIDPDMAMRNTEWFVMFRAAAEIEELAEIGRTQYALMTQDQMHQWRDHPLSPLGCDALDGITAWLDLQAQKVLEEMIEGKDRPA